MAMANGAGAAAAAVRSFHGDDACRLPLLHHHASSSSSCCSGGLRSCPVAAIAGPSSSAPPRPLRRRLPSLAPSTAAAAAAALRAFSVSQVKWILQPIGDGDCKHLDEAVPLPDAIELSLDVATLGRVPEKVDIVLPIATVSGLHARLERKAGTLFVTDLGSTNGTYINDKPIRAGGTGTPVPPGSRITFGDDHLAAFKFSIVEVEVETETENDKVEPQVVSDE